MNGEVLKIAPLQSMPQVGWLASECEHRTVKVTGAGGPDRSMGTCPGSRPPGCVGLRAHLVQGCWEEPRDLVGQEVPGDWVDTEAGPRGWGESKDKEEKGGNGALSKMGRPGEGVLN